MCVCRGCRVFFHVFRVFFSRVCVRVCVWGVLSCLCVLGLFVIVAFVY